MVTKNEALSAPDIDPTKALIEEFTSKFTSSLTSSLSQILAQGQNRSTEYSPPTENLNSSISVKLGDHNYSLWSQVAEMHLAVRDKLEHVDGSLEAPLTTEQNYKRWKTDDLVVKSWLVNSLEMHLVGNYIHYSTAKEVWDALSTAFSDGGDYSKLYDLKIKVFNQKQSGDSVDNYYNTLLGIWKEMDFRRPNPMTNPVDIEKHNRLVQEDRVYTFLYGLDEQLDRVRSDILQMIPFPSVEQAFARVRREEGRQGVMLGKPTGYVAMVSNGKRPILKTPSEFVANNYKEGQISQDKSHLKCTICGAWRHTKDMCFSVVGYPEWYIELQNRKGRKPKRGAGNAIIGFDPTGHRDPLTSVPSAAVLAATGSARPEVSGSGHPTAAGSIEPGFFGSGHTIASTDGAGLPNQLSLLPMGEGKMACALISKTNKCDDWIIDSGASDHMTYDPGDFVK